MTHHPYQTEAETIAARANSSGNPLRHPDVLATVAKAHGAKSWNSLVTPSPSGWAALKRWVSRQGPNFSSVISMSDFMYGPYPLDALSFGHVNGQRTDLSIDDAWLRRHVLLVGPVGGGITTLLHSLLLQQMRRGGGFLYLDSLEDLDMDERLERAAHMTGTPHRRSDFLAGEVDRACLVAASDQAAALYVPLPLLVDSEAVHASVTVFQTALRQLVAWRMTHRGARDKPPFLVVVPGAWVLEGAGMGALLAQARAANIALVIWEGSLGALGEKNEALILQNTATKIFLNSWDARALTHAAEFLAPYGVERNGDGTSFPKGDQSLAEALVSLGLGEAVALSGRTMQRLRLQMVDPKMSYSASR